MSYATAGLNAAVNGIASAGAYISMHTADPAGTGANEVSGGSYSRQQTTFATASSGSRVGSQVSIPIPASTTITHWGLWSAATAGTFLGGWSLPAQEAFGSAGTEQFTPTITAS